jgi:hypothetical protein
MSFETDYFNFYKMESGKDPNKELYHKKMRKHLKDYASNRLKLPKEEYDVRSNLGGFGVKGDIVLHTKELYLQVCGFSMERKDNYKTDRNILVRTCNGLKDYVGDRNYYISLSPMMDPDFDILLFLQNRPAQDRIKLAPFKG